MQYALILLRRMTSPCFRRLVIRRFIIVLGKLYFLKINRTLHPDNALEPAADHRLAHKCRTVNADQKHNIIAGDKKLIDFLAGVLVSDTAPVDDGAKNLVIVRFRAVRDKTCLYDAV